MSMIKVEHANKTFSGKYGKVHALQDVSIHVEKGDIYGIIGFSGAGKSTLIRLVNGLETLVFQQFNLLESKTVYHNIALPLILEKVPKAEIDKKVKEVLQFVELEDKKDVYVSQLSGGQKQRVGIARALTTTPDILLCDEPTGALDYNTSKEILKLIETVNQKYGNTIIMVTHNDAIQNMADRVVRLRDGHIRSNTLNAEKVPAEQLDW